MPRHFIFLSIVLVLLIGCNSDPVNQEQPEEIILVESKLDSIKSVMTVIINADGTMKDSRSNISTGTYKKDENEIIRSISLLTEVVTIYKVEHSLAIDMINLEAWDSTQLRNMKIDSSFMLPHISHLALSNITVGNISNEVFLPVRIEQDSFKTYIEGKTTLTLKDWGFDLTEEHKLHLGLSLYTLPEN